MSFKKKILIIHPEGNINSNPNLSGIVEILCENSFLVDILSDYNDSNYQKKPCSGSELILRKINEPDEYMKINEKITKTKYFFIFGIDSEGIIEASLLSKIYSIPYAYISYEILFHDDIGVNNKNQEIDACKNIEFAIVQDEIRGQLLCDENLIPKSKIIYIPVAGRLFVPRIKSNYLRQKYSIPNGKRIILYIGSIGSWTGADKIFHVFKSIKDSVLIIHSRYDSRHVSDKFMKIIKNQKNLYLSKDVYPDIRQMSKMFNSADAGIAFHCPVSGEMHIGKNVEFIGLSSGKTSTYVQHDLPVIFTISEPLFSLNNRYHFGLSIDSIEKLPSELKKFKFENDGCKNFFEDILSLDKNIIPVLNRLSKYDFRNNNSINFSALSEYQITMLKRQNISLANYIKNLENSKIYLIRNRIIASIKMFKKLQLWV